MEECALRNCVFDGRSCVQTNALPQLELQRVLLLEPRPAVADPSQGAIQLLGHEFGSLFAGGHRGACTGGSVTMVNPFDTPQGRTHAASSVQGGRR